MNKVCKLIKLKKKSYNSILLHLLVEEDQFEKKKLKTGA